MYLILFFLLEHTQARRVRTSPMHNNPTAIPKTVPTTRTSPYLPEDEGHTPVTAIAQLLVMFLRIADSAVAHEVLSAAAICVRFTVTCVGLTTTRLSVVVEMDPKSKFKIIVISSFWNSFGPLFF